MRLSSLLLCFSLAAPAGAFAKGRHFVACVPDAPASTQAATPYLQKFLRLLERSLGWPEESASGLFTRSTKRCVKELGKADTAFAILAPELFVQWQKKHHLKALAVAESAGVATTRYHVIVKKDGGAAFEKLSGATFFTTHGSDARFLARVVLGGKLGDDVRVKTTRRLLEALRAVHAGTAAATIVDDSELAKMKELPFAEELQAVFASEPLPNPIVVSVGDRAGPAAAGLAAKLPSVCQGEGASVCANLRLSGFAAPQGLEALTEKYGK